MTGAISLCICASLSFVKTVFRFGPSVLSWKDCTTPSDYIRRGLLQAAGYHVVVGAALLFWSNISQPSPVSFVRRNFASATGSRSSLSVEVYPVCDSVHGGARSRYVTFTLFHFWTNIPSKRTLLHLRFFSCIQFAKSAINNLTLHHLPYHSALSSSIPAYPIPSSTFRIPECCTEPRCTTAFPTERSTG